MKKEYVEMSKLEMENRIKKFQDYYPEFSRKFEAIREKHGPSFIWGDFLDDFQLLGIEFSLKCPDIIVGILGMELSNVSKLFY